MRATESTMSFLGRLRLWQKLAMLVAAMAVPAVVLGVFYFTEAAAGVHQARSELDGARYLKALGAVSAEMVTHRGRAYAFLNGDQARRDDVVAQAGEVDKQIVSMDAINIELGERLGVSQAWQDVKAEWSSLEAKTLQQTAEENDAAHTALAVHLNKLVATVGTQSMTAFDPERHTRALVRIASEFAPSLRLNGASMRRHAVRAASKGYLGGDDRMGILIFRERQNALFGRLSSALEDVSPQSKAELQPVVEAAKSAADDFYSVVESKILNASTLSVSGGAIYDAGVPTNRALRKVSLASYDALTLAVKERLVRLNERRAMTAGVTALALILALGLLRIITRSLSRPLRRAVSVFGKISAGHYDNQIDLTGTDEAGQVLRALAEMQSKLRTQLESERAMAFENARIRHALNKASTSVVLADAAHKIIYLNDTAQATFTRSQGEMSKSLHGFDALRVQGSDLEKLSADPGRERRALESLRSSEVQERTFGALTFRSVTSPVLNEKGERIGTVVEWTNRTHELGIEREVRSMLAAVVNGDLTARIPLQDKTGFFEAASRGVNQLADNLAETVATVKETAGEIYRGSQEISTGNTHLQQRTEQQSVSLAETASSMEEMTQTVRANAENASEANQLAIAARDQAEKGGGVVGKAVHAMAGINESARKIADIIGVIDEIAFQTNLLALNAAVEAARAGEQGRGFAVVASEVRTLAGRSASAAKEIKELIQDSVRKVGDGSVLVTQSGQTLDQIVASVKKVSDIVAEIAAASREQSSGIGQVNTAVVHIDQLTQQNAALVAQVSNASRSMAQEVNTLNQMLDGYRLGGDSDKPRQRATAVAARPSAEPRGVRKASAPAEGRSSDRGRKQESAPARTEKPRARANAAAADGATAGSAALQASDDEWQEF